MTARDFVDINYHIIPQERGGDCYYAGGMSASLSKYYDTWFKEEWPESRGVIRGSIYNGCGWYLKQQGDDVLMTYIILSELHGWFLPILVNSLIAGSYMRFFADLKEGWKEYVH